MPEPIEQGTFEDLLTRAGVEMIEDAATSSQVEITALSRRAINDAVRARGLVIPDAIIDQIHGSLQAGKHLLLTGPPGTGKTSLALALGEAAQSASVCDGILQTTASSDWSPTDTVGGYRMQQNSTLAFAPGQILEAIDTNRWIVVDELNRADIDRAIGPLFTVLSGQGTTLRYEEDTPGGPRKVAIVPFGQPIPAATRPYVLGPSWRLIATMNTADLDLLFEISQAFLRRFARIEIPAPDPAAHARLLEQYATGAGALDARVRGLAVLPHRPLGPAITIDAARYAHSRYSNGAGPRADIIFTEAVQIFIAPQLGHLPRGVRSEVEVRLDELSLSENESVGESQVSQLVNDALDVGSEEDDVADSTDRVVESHDAG